MSELHFPTPDTLTPSVKFTMDAIYLLLFGEALLIFGLIAPSRLAQVRARRGDYVGAARIYRRFYATIRPIPTMMPLAAYNLGAMEMVQGHLTEAQELFEQAIEKAERVRQPRTLAIARMMLALCAVWDGDTVGAERLLALAENERSQFAVTRLMMPLVRSQISLFRGDIATTRRLLDDCLKNFAKNSEYLLLTHYYFALCDYYSEDYASALKRLTALEKIPTLTNHLRTQVTVLQADCYAHLGNLTEADRLQNTLVQKLDRLDKLDKRSALAAIALVAAKHEDWERARHYANEALTLADKPSMQAGPLLIQAEAFLHYQNTARAQAVCEQILRLPVIPYFHRKAEELLVRIDPSRTPVFTKPEVTPPQIALAQTAETPTQVSQNMEPPTPSKTQQWSFRDRFNPVPDKTSSFVVQEPNREENTQQTNTRQ